MKVLATDRKQIERYQAFDAHVVVQDVADLRPGVEGVEAAITHLIGRTQGSAYRFITGDIAGQIIDLIAIKPKISGKAPHQARIFFLGLCDHHRLGDLEGAVTQHGQRHDTGNKQVAEQLGRDSQTQFHARTGRVSAESVELEASG